MVDIIVGFFLVCALINDVGQYRISPDESLLASAFAKANFARIQHTDSDLPDKVKR